MITRRTSLGVLVGLPAALAAFPDTSEAAGLDTAGARENCSFLQDVRKTMMEAVERGELDFQARKFVRCPLCSEQLAVTLWGATTSTA